MQVTCEYTKDAYGFCEPIINDWTIKQMNENYLKGKMVECL